jgi:hypothetical protein
LDGVLLRYALLDHVTPTGTRTWTLVTIVPDGVWTEQFTVTAAFGYSGTLTNVVQITTVEGVTGIYTETSEFQPVLAPLPTIYLPVVLKKYPP